MRLLHLVLLAIGVACLLPGCVERPGAGPKDLAGRLNEEERLVLEAFFRGALEVSEAGAVLWGPKPVCIDGFGVGKYPSPYQLGTRFYQYCNISSEGLDILEQLGRGKGQVVVVPCRLGDHRFYRGHLWVNRTSVLDVVKDHLDLFRMHLGPNTTPELVLENLLIPDVDLLEVVGNSRVLLGLLLGFGLENSLLHTRRWEIEMALLSGENFPLKKKMDQLGPQFPRISKGPWEGYLVKFPECIPLPAPSMGYESLEDEMVALTTDFGRSHEHPAAKGHRIPLFGCNLKSKETADLVQRYIVAAQRTVQMLESPDLLNIVLDQIC